MAGLAAIAQREVTALYTENIQKPDYLFGEFTQPSES